MKIKREALANRYIEDALLLLMEKKDYRDITITEICSRAGVTRMSFYRNFSGKDDILRRWIVSVTDSFLEESGISYRKDSIRDYFIKLFKHLGHYRDTCTLLYKYQLSHLIKEQFDRCFLRAYSEIYDEYKSYFLSGGIYNVFLLWLMNGCRETPEELAGRMQDILDK